MSGYKPDLDSAKKLYDELLEAPPGQEFHILGLMTKECIAILSNYNKCIENGVCYPKTHPVETIKVYIEDEVGKIRELCDRKNSTDFVKNIRELRVAHDRLMRLAAEFDLL